MVTSDHLDARIRARLAEIRGAGQERVLRAPSGVDLSSNDYLGLASHPDVARRMAAALSRDGVGSTGSRLLRGHRDAFAAIERRFAAFKGVERALYLGSGYAANLSVLPTFLEASDVVFSDALNHASLIDGMRLARARRVIVPHNDPDALARLMVDHPAGPGGQRFVVTESVFSMDGDEAALSAVVAVCRQMGAALILDEAHAVGVYGQNGRGLAEAAGVAGDVFLSIDTAGKALGVAGAFVSGSALAIEYLVQRARPFIFSTAPPPAVADALDASLTIVADEPERRRRVLALAAGLRARLCRAGISVGAGTSQIIPIMIGDNARAVAVASALQAAGFDVRAIRPPTVPEGTARLRISVNATLSDAVLDRFTGALGNALGAHAMDA